MVSSKNWIIISALATFQYHAVDGLDQYLTNDEKGGKQPVRVVIPSFHLTLAPTPGGPLSSIQEAVVHNAANTVLETMMPSIVPQGISVDYVRLVTAFTEDSLRHVRRQRMLQTLAAQNDLTNTSVAVTVMEIDGGVASFRKGNPSTEQVNAWVSEALQQPLLEYLQEQTDLSYIETITFTSLTNSPTSAPVAVSGSTKQVQPNNATHGMMMGIIIAVTALVGLIAVMAILALRRKRTVPTKSTISTTTATTNKDDCDPEPAVVTNVEKDDLESEENCVDEAYDEVDDELSSLRTNQNCDTSDTPSVAASEWTLSTTATDAFTVNSGGAVFARAGHSLLQTESFERDRQITIKKDMLQTTWSTTVPNNYAKEKDAALVPSHFSVDTMRDNDSFDADDDTRNSNDSGAASAVTVKSSSKVHVTGKPFLFEAHGEEIVLMPPSQTRTSRIL